MSEETFDMFFDADPDPIKNFKIIVGIMNKNNINFLNVKYWCDDSKAHVIEGTDKVLTLFADV